MPDLRDDQVELLERHRVRAREVLEGLLAEVEVSRGLPDPEAPAIRAVLGSEPDVQVSCAVSLLAGEHDRIQTASEATPDGEEPQWNPMLVMRIPLQKLQARRLPFSASDVELMLDMGLEETAFWLVPFPVAAAERVLSAEPGNPAVLAALERAARRLDGHWRGSYDAELRAARARIRALLAANVPGGLLDLSVLEGGDAWAEPAGAILASHAKRWDGVQDVLAHLAATRGSKPTKSWAGRMAQLLDAHPEAALLARELLEPVLEIDVVPTPEAVVYPYHWLLAPGNETIVKGAAWSLRLVAGDWVEPLLSRLALRGAARSPDDGVPTPLSAPVASGAIDSLISLGTDESRAELGRLLSEIRRRDLLKRIAAALDESPEDTAARDDAIRRAKQRAVRAKANPRPVAEQRDASMRVRTELAPRLWDLGFTSRHGRTFWRRHADRIEVLHVASNRGALSVEVGVWFAAPRRSHQPPIHDGELYPGIVECDLRAGLVAGDLTQTAVHAETWFLRFDDLAGVLSFLLSDADEGMFLGGAPGSPARDLLIGYLAPRAGRPELAAEHLARAAAFFREQLEERRRQASRDVTPEWEAWVEGLEADAAT